MRPRRWPSTSLPIRPSARLTPKGVTHLTIESPNTMVRGHLQDGWRQGQSNLHQFQQDIEALIEEFDEVRWI